MTGFGSMNLFLSIIDVELVSNVTRKNARA
jgi:hypothetical protein